MSFGWYFDLILKNNVIEYLTHNYSSLALKEKEYSTSLLNQNSKTTEDIKIKICDHIIENIRNNQDCITLSAGENEKLSHDVLLEKIFKKSWSTFKVEMGLVALH